MKINLVSFSDFNCVIDIYDKEKMDLFCFMLVKIIEKGSDKTIKEVLLDLSISEDLLYLYQNNFYYLLDNNLIINKGDEEDISGVIVNDIEFSEFGKYCLVNKCVPKYRESRNMHIIYDVLNKKLVSENKVNDSSNVVVIDEKIDFLKIINEYKKELINEYNDNFVLNFKHKEANPFYYSLDVSDFKDSYLIEYLKDNRVLLNDNKEIYGNEEFLSNNFKCKLVYCDESNMINSDYYLLCNDKREFEVNGNKVYIGVIDEFKDYSFVDINKDVVGYKVSKIKIKEDDYSVVKKDKLKANKTDLKKYLVKNRDKFTNVRVVNEIIDLL